jgi:hypothetical protein
MRVQEDDMALVDVVATTLVETMMPVTTAMIAAGVAASNRVTTRRVKNSAGGYDLTPTSATTAVEFVAIWQAMLAAKLQNR